LRPRGIAADVLLPPAQRVPTRNRRLAEPDRISVRTV
jgi:hypothetical protein